MSRDRQPDCAREQDAAAWGTRRILIYTDDADVATVKHTTEPPRVATALRMLYTAAVTLVTPPARRIPLASYKDVQAGPSGPNPPFYISISP